ncbi:MAG TPA: sulfatase-like hydrolase/transferase [bacterium]|nr:sulfatase-like hydrolase/transferase [bacterium]HQL61068.1 sulfatase-like hydrolase/transferase [bacterium]
MNEENGFRMNRRDFLYGTACAAAMSVMSPAGVRSEQVGRPNILWLTTEDMSPDLGCYGDTWAITPNIDRLALQGVRYSNAFSVAGVCAPSRSALITGMYPCSIGTHPMRCQGVPPSYVKCFPEYLRAAGYYCTNNFKTDYNFDSPITAWDECSRVSHWRNRPANTPFFAVFNQTVTHESEIRAAPEDFAKNIAALKPEERHNPDDARVPPYYPDTPITRNDWARYYDLVTAMDYKIGDLLKQLEEDGLAENTVVFFFSDHGRGLPRAKRWLYDSGLHVPFIIRWPGVIEPGTTSDRLVSFVDFAPTVLSIAGIPVPKTLQGQAFLGEQDTPPRKYIYGARDRMDETYDIIRAVRDKQYKYIRNFQPGKPYAQYIHYMEEMPTMQEMRLLNKTGELKGPQKLFFLPEKPKEELYDITQDPHEINNLAARRECRPVLKRMRKALKKWMDGIDDLAFVPEDELNERVRPGGVWSVTESPRIVPAGGTFEKPVLVEISCPTEGSSIAYTTDTGEKPHWLLYSQPFRLENSVHLRAVACRLGYKDSEIVEADFKVGGK